MQYDKVLYRTVQYIKVQYSTMQYRLQYSIVQSIIVQLTTLGVFISCMCLAVSGLGYVNLGCIWSLLCHSGLCLCSNMFLPMPLAVAWVNRWTFSSHPPSPPSFPSSHHQLFVSLMYRKRRGAWVLCFFVTDLNLNYFEIMLSQNKRYCLTGNVMYHQCLA